MRPPATGQPPRPSAAGGVPDLRNGWRQDKAELKKISEGFKVPTDGRQWELQTLLIAKGNNQKILVEVDEGKFYDSSVEIHKITLY